MTAPTDPRLTVLRANLAILSEVVSSRSRRVAELEAELQRLRATSQSPAAARGDAPRARRGRAAVISWDLAHNPVGRAVVLYDLLERDYDVELIGPIWQRFGGAVWKPIQGGRRKLRGFPCETFEQFWPAALAVAETSRYDLVVVCKPRLPAILLGALIKKKCGCPLVMDIDDLELTFVDDATPASLDDLEADMVAALREPYGTLATRACDGLAEDADAVVVSNVALRKRYGGTIVRHARAEETFQPGAYDREAERARLGIAAGEFAIMFAGTPRAHKGIFEIAATLDRLADDRLVLHVLADVTDRRVLRSLDQYPRARIVLHPGCAFDDLPAHLSAANAVVLLQDRTHPVSQYQIPAKISDAAAFGLPILCTDVPPVRDLAELGLVTLIEPEELDGALTRLLAQKDDRRHWAAARAVRSGFEAELGLAVNRLRLGFAVSAAMAAPRGLPATYERVLSIAGAAYAQMRRFRVAPAAPPARAVASDAPDLVLFWKQNDTGMFGRRPDMVARYLLASGRIGRILHLDAPLEIDALDPLPPTPDASRSSATALQIRNTIDNQYALRDGERHLLRTFLWDRSGRGSVLPSVASSTGDYPAWVADQMRALGMRPENTFAWVCPVVFDFPAVAAAIPFRAVIGDLIDDQRAFDLKPAYRRRVEAAYEATLPLCDVVFTNCEPVAAAFAQLAPRIHVVPNGTELGPGRESVAAATVRGLPRPVAGYVGNLRDRVHWELLHEVAAAMGDVTFVIVGGGERREDTEILRDLPNVVFTGVVPYEDVASVIRSFDVALMPHRTTALTSRMNPLKMYNYFSAGRPIVSTTVENIDPGIARYVRFADEPEDFASAIRDAIASGIESGPDYDRLLASLTWDRRVARMLDIVDAWEAERPPVDEGDYPSAAEPADGRG